MTPRVGLRRAPLGVGLLSVFGLQSVRVAGQCLRYVPADSRERHEKNGGVVESESTTGPSLSLLFDSTCRTKASLQMRFVERHERNDAEEVRNLSTTSRHADRRPSDACPWNHLLEVDRIPASAQGSDAGASPADHQGNGPANALSSLRCVASAREGLACDPGHFRLAAPQQVDFVWCQHPGSGRGTDTPIE